MSLISPDGRFELQEESGASDHWGGVTDRSWIVLDKQACRVTLRFSSNAGIDSVWMSKDGWQIIAKDKFDKEVERIDLRELAAEIDAKKKTGEEE